MIEPEKSSVPGGPIGHVGRALRERTRSQHESLEQRVRLMEDDVSLAYYRAYLGAMLGYCEPVEEALAALPGWSDALPDHGQRNKAALIRRDLATLGAMAGAPSDAGAGAEAFARCPYVVPLRNIDDAFGATYVLEGSTLGGQVLARHLGQRLGVDAARGAAFLASYGKEVGPMWRRFCDALERHAASDARATEAIVAAAGATFTAIDRWFQERLSET